MNIVLIGFMGSGKTEVGRLLAKKLAWKFIDSDAVIESESKMTIKEIFTKWGEPRFRKMEAKTIRKLSSLNHCIIATGGGAPVNPATMKNLKKNSVVIWLKAPPSAILSRIKCQSGGITGRPLVNGQAPLKSIQWLLIERTPYYQRADIVMNTSGLSPAVIANKLLKKLKIPICK